MSFVERFSKITKGGILFIGNTLGLSKLINENKAGTEGAIGAFSSVNQRHQVLTFPEGTTLNYLENGSEAELLLPSGAEVVYAELIWGGLCKDVYADISNLTNNSVKFVTPQGEFLISPDVETRNMQSLFSSGYEIGFYTRTADVTGLVKQGHGGFYQTLQVPAIMTANEGGNFSTAHAGWTLAVVYKDATQPVKKLNLWVGCSNILNLGQNAEIEASGFKIPSSAPYFIRLWLSVQEGDGSIPGDKLLFGQRNSLHELSGPNNPADNFFCSQINDENGNLKTTGTHGNRNHVPHSQTNIEAGRQGWDITAVKAFDKLQPNTTSAIIRYTTQGDAFMPNATAVEFETRGACLQMQKSANKTVVSTGEEVEYTLQIVNEGDLNAVNLLVEDVMPQEFSLTPNSITINGSSYSGSFPIAINSLQRQESIEIKFRGVFVTTPMENPFSNKATLTYQHSPDDISFLTEVEDSNSVEVLIIKKEVSIEKKTNRNFVVNGEIIEYSISITNSSSVALENLFFIDPAPRTTKFVEESFVVDGRSVKDYEPSLGLNIGGIEPNQTINISFKVRAN